MVVLGDLGGAGAGLMTPGQREALAAYEQAGRSYRAGARLIGRTYSLFHRQVTAALRYSEAPEGQKAAIEAAGLDIESASHGWRVIPRDDGGRDSVFWKAQPDTAQDVTERLRDAFLDLPPAQLSEAPQDTSDDLLALIPVADMHSGMMAWAAEAGEDYSTKIATERLVDWAGQIVSTLPRCRETVILFNGDTLHANDASNVTPRGKHALDTDTRHFRTLELTVDAICITANTALLRNGYVRIVILPGNHDPEAYMALLLALHAYYRNDPRVTVEKGPSDFWAYLFGRVLLMAHHGHRAKPKDLVLSMAAEFAEMWGRSKRRYLWTGHMHHHKSDDIGGVHWEQSRAVAARDAHSASHPYPAHSELQGIVYHRYRGEIMRVRVSR